MARIGILTFHFSENHGALLQAYGLKGWLSAQGHEVEFINYHPEHVEAGGRFRRPFDPRMLKANAKVAYLKLTGLQRSLLGNREEARRFEAFRDTMLRLSGPPLRTRGDVAFHLATMERPYDAIVMGSDQIWASSQQAGLDPVYFGDFAAPAGTRLIAYAPSFGRATVAEEDRAELTRMLGGIDSLSARERSGVAIIRELTGREAPNVPDPTILLGDFRALAVPSEGAGDHVFCYALRSGQGIREVAELAAVHTGGAILSPANPHRRWREIGRTVHPTPAEWVGLAERAAFIVTNSFHGTVFSILLRRPFLTVGLTGSRQGLNERSLNLLRELGLEDRFVPDGDLAVARRRMAEPIDWDAATARLAMLQAAGRDYLAGALGFAADAR